MKEHLWKVYRIKHILLIVTKKNITDFVIIGTTYAKELIYFVNAHFLSAA